MGNRWHYNIPTGISDDIPKKWFMYIGDKKWFYGCFGLETGKSYRENHIILTDIYGQPDFGREYVTSDWAELTQNEWQGMLDILEAQEFIYEDKKNYVANLYVKKRQEKFV